MGERDKIIIIGADHNGVELKKLLEGRLLEEGYLPIDIGPYDSEVSVDYVDYARQVSHVVEKTPHARGVLICGTGVGMSIAANRFGGVRAALVHNIETAPKCREHNDSNVLCLGSWINSPQDNEEILFAWLNEAFGEGRHNKRIVKLGSQHPSRLVFTNGVFDILHTGHVELLNYAAKLGDKLVVAINNDTSVRELKGRNRPVNTEVDRKKILESMREVDEVIIFDGNLKEVREKVSPDVVVKGGEWTEDEVRVRDHIPSTVDIKIYPLVEHYSTTNTIQKIRDFSVSQKNEF